MIKVNRYQSMMSNKSLNICDYCTPRIRIEERESEEKTVNCAWFGTKKSAGVGQKSRESKATDYRDWKTSEIKRSPTKAASMKPYYCNVSLRPDESSIFSSFRIDFGSFIQLQAGVVLCVSESDIILILLRWQCVGEGI